MMITKPVIKNDVWIDKLYYIFFPRALKLLLRAVKLSLLLFCFSASINIQNNSKRWIEPFSEAFSEKLSINKAKIAEAVWKIKGNGWRGTGFFISENQIVTNAHVVEKVADIEEITIVQEGNPRRLKAGKLARLSIRYDLAVLEVDEAVSDFLSLPEDPLNSSNVYALGYPNGQFKKISQTGVLEEKDYFFSDMPYIWGASGSPVLNEADQLAGVLYQRMDDIIVFIEVETLKSFIKDEYFLCEGSIQECFKSLRESFEKNTQEVKSGKDSYNIYKYLRRRGDWPRAKWRLKKAAEQGYFPAQNELAGMYLNGAGEEEDKLLAIEWMVEMAEQGYAPAQHNLAWMYYIGKGVKQDRHRARELYERAAEQGYTLSQDGLAVMYYKRGGGQDIP